MAEAWAYLVFGCVCLRSIASTGGILQECSLCARRTVHTPVEPCRRCLQAAHSGQGGEARAESQGPSPDVQRLCVLLARSPAPPLVQAARLPEGALSRGEPLLHPMNMILFQAGNSSRASHAHRRSRSTGQKRTEAPSAQLPWPCEASSTPAHSSAGTHVLLQGQS